MSIPRNMEKAPKIKAPISLGGKKLIPFNDVKKKGEWVLKRQEKKLVGSTPPEAGSLIPVGYIWARDFEMPGTPACGAEIPLVRQT